MTHLLPSNPACFPLRVRVAEVLSAFPRSMSAGGRTHYLEWGISLENPVHAGLADREWRQACMQGVYLAHVLAAGSARLQRPCPEPAWVVNDARAAIDGPFMFGEGSPDGLDEDSQAGRPAVRALRRERAIGLLLRDLQTVKEHLRRLARVAFADDFSCHGRRFVAEALRVHMRQLALLARDRDDDALLDLDALPTHPAVLEAAAWCRAISTARDEHVFALHRALDPVPVVDLNRRLATAEIVRGIESFYILRRSTVDLPADWIPVHYWLSRHGEHEHYPTSMPELQVVEEFHEDMMDNAWGPRHHASRAAAAAFDPVRVLELENESWLAREERRAGSSRSWQERPVRALGDAKAHPFATEYAIWKAFAVPDSENSHAEEAQARSGGDHRRANELRLLRRARERVARARCAEQFKSALPRPAVQPVCSD